VIGVVKPSTSCPAELPQGHRARSIGNLLACDTTMYVGDDDTDEDALRAATSDRLFAIRIGAKRRSRTRHWLNSQCEVDAFLQALLSLWPSPNRDQQG